MNDFDYDCMQKKRTARGAFAHISRKRGGCTLPSDNLTAKQRREKNGEVKSYNITRTMPWAEFKAMPEDLKREFFRNMQSFGGTAKWLAEEMGVSDVTIGAAAKDAGVPFTRGNGNWSLWNRKVAEWANADQQPATERPVEEIAVQEPRKSLTLEHAHMEISYTSLRTWCNSCGWPFRKAARRRWNGEIRGIPCQQTAHPAAVRVRGGQGHHERPHV